MGRSYIGAIEQKRENTREASHIVFPTIGCRGDFFGEMCYAGESSISACGKADTRDREVKMAIVWFILFLLSWGAMMWNIIRFRLYLEDFLDFMEKEGERKGIPVAKELKQRLMWLGRPGKREYLLFEAIDSAKTEDFRRRLRISGLLQLPLLGAFFGSFYHWSRFW